MTKKILLLSITAFAVISLTAFVYSKNSKNLSQAENISAQEGEISQANLSAETQPNEPEASSQEIDSNLLLPDLRIEPLVDPRIQLNQSGRKVLRFPGTFTNIGEGPLELIGQKDSETNTTRATQRIYKKEGEPDERLVGNFVVHPTHNHWHFENFVEFELYSYKEDGSLNEQLLTTGKMTFCIHDFAPSDESLPGKPERQVYPQCISEIQGISVGWADTYQSHVSGQELDITDIADGRYAFQGVADPENRITEKDETNNTSIVYIEIKGNTVEILSTP